MFPGVNGFHWSPAHLIFLTLFGLVVATLLTTLSIALWRTLRDLRSKRAEEIRWHVDFEDLPRAERMCRHAMTGTAPNRVCPRAFDCRQCQEHPIYAAREAGCAAEPSTFGLTYPEGRYYHRGHTWVEPQSDGTVLVGLDDLGTRIAGTPNRIEWPRPGQVLSLNGPAWTMIRGNQRIPVRAPIDGEVVATGGSQNGWYLRLKPLATPVDVRHLLEGTEVSAWLRTEMDRLHVMLSPGQVGASLADGGVLLADLPAAMPNAPWDHVTSAMFLEP